MGRAFRALAEEAYDREMRVRRLGLVAVALVTTVGLVWLAATAVDAGVVGNDCNNIAGTCVRGRQRLVLDTIGVICAVGAAGCVWVAATIRPATIRDKRGVVLVASLVLVCAIAAINPVAHLDNRRSGWLSDPGS